MNDTAGQGGTGSMMQLRKFIVVEDFMYNFEQESILPGCFTRLNWYGCHGECADG